MAVLAATTPFARSDNFVVGHGPAQANPNRVRVFDATGAPTPTDFLAYSAGQWGVNVSSADVNPGGVDDIATGPGPGPQFGPQVKAFLADGTAIAKVNFYSYGTLKSGVNVATGDIDGADEFLTGPGPGGVFGPHVRGWDYDGTNLTAIVKVSYFAYSTLKYGVNVGAGGIDLDGFDEILTCPGPGPVFGSNVRGWNYDNQAIGLIAKVNFFAFTNPSGGGRVVGGDFDDDTNDEMAASAAGQAAGFNFDGASVTAMTGFTIAAEATGSGDIGGMSGDDLMVGDATTSDVVAYDYDGTQLTQILAFSAFSGYARVTLAGGDLGF
ncbi:MAG: hypothetical protein U0166_20675 [Acidobacteriota bacterium]